MTTKTPRKTARKEYLVAVRTVDDTAIFAFHTRKAAAAFAKQAREAGCEAIETV